MARLSWHSLRVRLLLLVLLGILPGIGLILYGDSKERRYLAGEAEENVLRLVRIVAADHERLIKGAHHLLIALAQLPQVRGGDPRACSALFEDLLRQYPFYTGFVAAKPNGDLFCSAPLRDQPVSFADRPWYQHLVQTREFVVGGYQIGRLSGRAVVVLGYPVLDATARLQGIVATALDLAWLNRLAAEAKLPPGSVLTVMDRNGSILARHPDPEKWVGQSFRNAPILEAVLSQREGTARAVGMDGILRLYAFAPLRGGRDTGAYVSIGIPIAVALAEANHALSRNLVGLGLVAALAFGATWLAAGRFILRPVHALVGATKQFAAGDFTARTRLPYGRGEVSQLAQAFDEMAAALERHLAERQRAEEALRESERKHRDLAELLPQIVFETDRQGNLTFANRQGLAMFGYTPEDLGRGLNILGAIAPADRERARVNIRRVLDGEQVSGGEYTALRKDGSTFPIAVYSAPILHGAEPVGLRGILVDITELRRAEVALGTRTAQLEAIRTVTEEITRELNLPRLLNMIAEPAAELVDAPSGVVYLWDEASKHLVPRAWRGVGDWVREVRIGLGEAVAGTIAERRSGMIVNEYRTSPYAHPLFLERMAITAVLGEPLLYQDRLLGVITLSHQDTERTFTEEDRRVLSLFASQAAIAIENARLYEELRLAAIQSEAKVEDRTRELQEAMRQIEEASRHKSEFLASMSHELRTPLNSILGFSELLKEQSIGPLNERQARYVGHIHQSGAHLLQLISDILDLAKVEAGKIVLQPEPLPVAPVLEDILVIGRGLANKKAQDVKAEIEPNLHPLQADPVRFKQICFNLLSNAVKFTPEHGTITVRVRSVNGQADLHTTADRRPQTEAVPGPPSAVRWLELTVRDTGIGIRAEDLGRLFQEFVQLESTQAQRHEGTGLGLALTKRLVELHGGRIWAESEGEGRGSTFTVVLPFNGPAG